ncbi:MAG: hypothetical protein WCV90_06470 [Candidatus Woesearchaeota archaeon]|jgi:hypothetical protein
MGFLSRLFGKAEPVEESVIQAELKENKDMLWERVSDVLSYVDNDLRPELVRAQQKKWARATISDFRNFYTKIRDGRMRLEKDMTRIEAVPLQNPSFQEYSHSISASVKKMSEELKIVENQLSGEKNITEVTDHITEGINAFDELKNYWATRVRKQFLD